MPTYIPTPCSWTALPSSRTCRGEPTTSWPVSPHSWPSWRPSGISDEKLVANNTCEFSYIIVDTKLTKKVVANDNTKVYIELC